LATALQNEARHYATSKLNRKKDPNTEINEQRTKEDDLQIALDELDDKHYELIEKHDKLVEKHDDLKREYAEMQEKHVGEIAKMQEKHDDWKAKLESFFETQETVEKNAHDEAKKAKRDLLEGLD
jgi:predicted  nucleic acid-binding Zn-ribbon protein